MFRRLMDVVGSSGHGVEVKRFEGPPQRGQLVPAQQVSSPTTRPTAAVCGGGVLPRFEFVSAAGGTSNALDWTTVKTIEFLRNVDEESEPQVRFFDSVEPSPYLWVRLTLTDHEILEGRIENSLELLSGDCLLLYPLDEGANRECVCVPRQSIAAIQIVTLRH